MSVLLIRPMTPESSRKGLVSVQYPINIGYLASYLKLNGISCLVKDYEVEPFCTDDLFDLIESSAVSLIGFSCMTPHVNHAAFVAGIIKERYPSIPVVAGGVHPSAVPERTLLEIPQFDLVVVGEGEVALLELYHGLSTPGAYAGMKGLAYRADGSIVVNPVRPPVADLDQLPFPDRKLVAIGKYQRSHVSRGFSRLNTNIAEIITSRGCPYDCIFCASKVVHSRNVRFRSAANVIAELAQLIDEHGITHFSFLDDMFTLRGDILEAVCNYLAGQKITFDCLTRVDDIDERKLALLKRSGCRKIGFGVESGSDRILRLLKKNTTTEQIHNAFHLARKAGIQFIEATFLLGSHPDETMDDVLMTERLIYSLKADLMGVFLAVPYPGTELNNMLKARGFLGAENWDEYSIFYGKPGWCLTELSIESLQKIQKRIYRTYYLNPFFILRSFLKLRSPREFMYLAASAFSLFRSVLRI